MPDEMKPLRVTINSDNPMQFSDVDEQSISQIDEIQRNIVRQLAATFKAYREASKELLVDKYKGIRELVPNHIKEPGNTLITCCEDGIAIRYEKLAEGEEPKLFVGWASEKLSDVVPVFSQSVVFCYEDENFISLIPEKGATISLFKTEPSTGQHVDILTLKVGFDAVLKRPIKEPRPPLKPFCLVSVQNHFELGLHLKLDSAIDGRDVLVRTPLRLPVGWECIEVFPFLNIEMWKPEFAASWAENDILASVVARQARENHYQSLDPNVSVRKNFEELLRAYKELLDLDPEREEVLQKFLEDHPQLLCPAFARWWPKIPLGNKVTDFVFQDATGDYLLVEIERSTLDLFKANGDTSRDLDHARNQILDWRRYIEDNLATVQRELNLIGISSNPRSLIVIGRSKTLSEQNRRKLIAIENESPRTRIWTYDDVLINIKAIVENLVGPLWETTGKTEIYNLSPNSQLDVTKLV